MKNLAPRLAVAVSLAVLAGCNTGDAHRDGTHRSPGEAAGKAVYDIEKGAKKATKELSKEIKEFGHDAKAGFQQEKAKDKSRTEK